MTLQEALEVKQRMRETLEMWRSMGRLDYPLNEAGKVARLEDARDLVKVLSNTFLTVLTNPNVHMIMALTDPVEYQFMGQLAVIAHTLACDDPECRINNPELGTEEGAA